VNGQFQRALERRNLRQAIALAHELPTISLRDALRLCLLLAEDDRQRYERAAVRWISRYAADAGAQLEDVQLEA
jgi:hypothetical protein